MNPVDYTVRIIFIYRTIDRSFKTFINILIVNSVESLSILILQVWISYNGPIFLIKHSKKKS